MNLQGGGYIQFHSLTDCYMRFLRKESRLRPGVSDSGDTSLHSCSAVKTPAALKLEALPPYTELWFITITILYLYFMIRSTTCPIDVRVATQGGGLLIIDDRGAFIYMIVCKLGLAHKTYSMQTLIPTTTS